MSAPRGPEPSQEPGAARDWEWRRRIRSNAHSHRAYKWVVALVGLLIVAGGLALVPLPGPGWLVVFLGLAVWASEFAWASGLLGFARRTVRAWGDWLRAQRWYLKGLVGLGTGALVAAFFYLTFLVAGVPAFLPDVIERPLRTRLGL